MVELSKDIIGTSSEPFKFLVERGKIKEFCLAIGESDPIYLDVQAAQKAGFEDTPVPPTFPTVFTFWGNPDSFKDMQEMGVNVERLLHMKQQYRYFRPIYPATELHCSRQVTDVKKSKMMDMVTFESLYKDEKGNLFLEEEMTIVIRP